MGPLPAGGKYKNERLPGPPGTKTPKNRPNAEKSQSVVRLGHLQIPPG